MDAIPRLAVLISVTLSPVIRLEFRSEPRIVRVLRDQMIAPVPREVFDFSIDLLLSVNMIRE